MDAYIDTMFWLGLFSAVVRVFWLCSEHPRHTKTNIGTDVFGMLLGLGFLGWVAYLKYFS